MPRRKQQPDRIERFQHNIAAPFGAREHLIGGEEPYPDLGRFFPVRRTTTYKTDGLVPPKTTLVNRLETADGAVLIDEAPQPLIEWIVEASHAYECLLKRKTDPSGHRGRLIGQLVIPVNPTTKKNSSQLITNQRGHPILIPSRLYRQYVDDVAKLGKSIWRNPPTMLLPLDRALNIEAIYYRKDHRRCDITNLESALMDLLVSLKIIADDNFKIVCNTDGSRVRIDKNNPRTEINIYAWDT